jgi:hypothetical protein
MTVTTGRNVIGVVRRISSGQQSRCRRGGAAQTTTATRCGTITKYNKGHLSIAIGYTFAFVRFWIAMSQKFRYRNSCIQRCRNGIIPITRRAWYRQGRRTLITDTTSFQKTNRRTVDTFGTIISR